MKHPSSESGPARWRHLMLLLTPLFALASGCSSFDRAWREAGTKPPATTLEGRWEGHWRSEFNGHNGALKCIVTPAGGAQYHARFRATYMKVLRFSYTVPLEATHTNGFWSFSGQEDLGAMAGGIYRYEGTATLTNFHSVYRSKHDHGVFEMVRP